MKVNLEAFFETGTEGTYWSLYDPTKTGYDGLIILEEGDKLIIPGKWEGIIEKDRETNRKWYFWAAPFAEKEDWKGLCEHFDTQWPKEWTIENYKEFAYSAYTQQVAGGLWVHWLQKGVDPDEWARWFCEGLEAEYIQKKDLAL